MKLSNYWDILAMMKLGKAKLLVLESNFKMKKEPF